MRAVAVRKNGDTPELMEVAVPRPAPGEILVQLAAASVNPIDAGIAGGFSRAACRRCTRSFLAWTARAA
jgi:NADPH:quinone reductase-like Zn-dependent oxidoreductase